MGKTVLVTGLSGQDASYLIEFLLDRGYEITGLARHPSAANHQNIKNIASRIKIEIGDINDRHLISSLVGRKFDEIYNLAAQSNSGESFIRPLETFRTNAESVISFLDDIREYSPITRFFQAASADMYGGDDYPDKGYNEESEPDPRSPYAIAKMAAFRMVKNYREVYNLKCCSGILFSHESPRRGEGFVTKKICDWVRAMVNAGGNSKTDEGLRTALGRVGPLKLGNLDVRRDWTHARDIVRGMYMCLNQGCDPMQDFILGSGKTRSLFEFVATTIRLGLGRQVMGNPEVTKIIDHATGLTLVESDRDLYRKADVFCLKADASKAKTVLGWEPTIPFDDMVKEMI
jgi:GDPmannose 4,6-dehydratase